MECCYSTKVSSTTLAIGSCKIEKRAAKLHLAVSCSNFMDFELLIGILFSNNHGRSFPTCCTDINLDLVASCRIALGTASIEASTPAVLSLYQYKLSCADCL